MICKWCGSGTTDENVCDGCFYGQRLDPEFWIANTKFVSEERRAEAAALAAKTRPVLGPGPGVSW